MVVCATRLIGLLAPPGMGLDATAYHACAADRLGIQSIRRLHSLVTEGAVFLQALVTSFGYPVLLPHHKATRLTSSRGGNSDGAYRQSFPQSLQLQRTVNEYAKEPIYFPKSYLSLVPR